MALRGAYRGNCLFNSRNTITVREIVLLSVGNIINKIEQE